MAAKAIIQSDYDQFSQKTTKKTWKTKLYEISESGNLKHFNITIMGGFRYVKTPEAEVIVIDVEIWAQEWFFSRNGKIDFVIDNENFSSDGKESSSELDKMLPGRIIEETYYIISKELLEKIASSQNLAVRISGSNSSAEIKANDVTKFKILAQQFYNKVFDETKFTDSINKSTSSSSGCFIATAAMGDYNHPLVVDLRIFRDNWLMKRKWGIKFTNLYYKHGPKAASIIEKSVIFKKLTYLIIVKPLYFIAKKIN
jgi:hypothetical protein